MTRPLTPRQIAWRLAQDLPRGAHVMLGPGMPLFVPDHVAEERGIIFERETLLQRDSLLQPDSLLQRDSLLHETANYGPPRAARRFDHCVLGAREVAQNGDLVVDGVAASGNSLEHTGSHACAATVRQVFAMSEYFAPDGRPVLVPQCSVPPSRERCVATLYTDIAILDLRDGKAWLREIIEGITLHVLQAETDVQLHVAPDLRLLHAPDLR